MLYKRIFHGNVNNYLFCKKTLRNGDGCGKIGDKESFCRKDATVAKMKKIISILLLLALVTVSFAACKGGTDPSNSVGTTTTTKPSNPKDDPAVDTVDYATEVKQNFKSLSESPATDFSYVKDEQGVTITDYLGESDRVRVPAQIDGVSVVKIADGAFAECKSLKVLYLPNSVVSLGKGILKDCDALTAIRTPLLSAKAQDKQFLGYLFGAESRADNILVPASLVHVWLDGAVDAVSEYAFADCNKLVAVLLGDEIRKIGDFSFYLCEKLKYVNLTGLEQIGDFAFAYCNAFVHATLGARLEQVGFGALQGCAALSSVTLPFVGGSQTENTYFGYVFGAAEPDFTAGYIPAYLRTVTLLDTCKSLENYAFFECSSLRTVVLPKQLTSIGVRAFEGCEEIKALDLSSVKTIRENAFFGCASLETVTFGESLQDLGINAFYGCSALKSIALPDSLTSLPASAFADCDSLETVDLGGVERVGKNAFRNCTDLKTVNLGSEVEFEDGNDLIQNLIQ